MQTMATVELSDPMIMPEGISSISAAVKLVTIPIKSEALVLFREEAGKKIMPVNAPHKSPNNRKTFNKVKSKYTTTTNGNNIYFPMEIEVDLSVTIFTDFHSLIKMKNDINIIIATNKVWPN
jgi:hypothetical protein